MGSADHVDVLREQWARVRPELDTSPLAVMGRLHRVALLLTDQLTALYGELGLTEGEFDILCALRRSGDDGLAPADVARQTMVTTGGNTKRLQRLEARGLVRRRGDRTDGRKQVLTLSSRGRTLIDEAYPRHLANERRLLDTLSPDDRQLLEALLRRWLPELERSGDSGHLPAAPKPS